MYIGNKPINTFLSSVVNNLRYFTLKKEINKTEYAVNFECNNSKLKLEVFPKLDSIVTVKGIDNNNEEIEVILNAVGGEVTTENYFNKINKIIIEDFEILKIFLLENSIRYNYENNKFIYDVNLFCNKNKIKIKFSENLNDYVILKGYNDSLQYVIEKISIEKELITSQKFFLLEKIIIPKEFVYFDILISNEYFVNNAYVDSNNCLLVSVNNLTPLNVKLSEDIYKKHSIIENLESAEIKEVSFNLINQSLLLKRFTINTNNKIKIELYDNNTLFYKTFIDNTYNFTYLNYQKINLLNIKIYNLTNNETEVFILLEYLQEFD